MGRAAGGLARARHSSEKTGAIVLSTYKAVVLVFILPVHMALSICAYPEARGGEGPVAEAGPEPSTQRPDSRFGACGVAESK